MRDEIIAVKIEGKKGPSGAEGDRAHEEPLVDLHTEIATDTPFKPVRRDTPEGLEVIRHSTAHVMADAVQRLFPGTKVTFGPATDNGFYYDFDKKDGGFTDEDMAKIEAKMREIIAKK